MISSQRTLQSLKAEGNMNIFIIENDEASDDIKITHSSHLKRTLEEVLGVDNIELIPTGNGDVIDELNNGMMVQTHYVSVQVVITYDRNYVSNNLLRKHGIKVIEIPGSELVRGRGPRCMSQPLFRRFIESYSNTCYSVVEIAFNFKTNHIKF